MLGSIDFRTSRRYNVGEYRFWNKRQIQSWRNIDVVTSIMNDRCLREKFACPSLAENVHKKNNFTTTSSFEKLGQINCGGV